MLLRTERTDDAILSKIYVDGVFECFGLEHVGVEIQPGRYPVVITPSAHFGRLLPLVENVPGRSGIRIHPGNVPDDSEGCILVGQSRAVDSVLDSRLAMAALQPKIAGALAHGEQVFITIVPANVETTLKA